VPEIELLGLRLEIARHRIEIRCQRDHRVEDFAALLVADVVRETLSFLGVLVVLQRFALELEQRFGVRYTIDDKARIAQRHQCARYT
jgi:hypothetical protein